MTNERLWEEAVEATERAYNALKEGDLPELQMMSAWHALDSVKDTLEDVRQEQYRHETAPTVFERGEERAG